MKQRLRFFLLCVSVWGSCLCAPAFAAGLSTAFADVQVHNVPLGVSYKLSQHAGKQLDIQNLGDAPVQVQVSVLIPSPADLRGQAQALPDAGWVEVHPSHLEIPPHGKALVDVLITVPKKKEYRHQTYQVKLWTQSRMLDGRGGMSINAGLFSRLRFTTEK